MPDSGRKSFSPDQLHQTGKYWATHQNLFCGGRHWKEIPAVKERINSKITGDPKTDIFAYVVHEYFEKQGREPEKVLTLGCGAGELERSFAKYCRPQRHDAIDISENLIRSAREQAIAFPYIHYSVADLNNCELAQFEYDLVLAHQSLHHVLNLEKLFDRTRKAMRPGGLFVLDEYVGPSQLQWTDHQLEVINGIMQVLPRWLTVDVETSQQRRNVIRCTREQVAAADPSEAIRSHDILALANDYFKVIEFHAYGGSVLHMLFHMIAGNFLLEQAKPWLEVIFQIEDLLVPELGNDFAAAICTVPDGQ